MMTYAFGNSFDIWMCCYVCLVLAFGGFVLLVWLYGLLGGLADCYGGWVFHVVIY